jgi:G3E family GTPase
MALQIARLARDGRFDYVLIESTGIAEPMHAAESFTMDVGAMVPEAGTKKR